MLIIEKYIVVLIAVWRLTHLLSSEDGLLDLILKFRKILGNSFIGKIMDGFLLPEYLDWSICRLVYGCPTT